MKQRKYKQSVKLGVSVLLLGCLLAPLSVPCRFPGSSTWSSSGLTV